MKKFPLIFVLLSLLSGFASAQTVQPTATPPENDDVVKITTTLIQIDAVVTDKKGNQIKDLAIDDIEILQDGKPQKITNLTYIDTAAGKSANVRNTVKFNKKIIPPPPITSSSAAPGRIITFVVDDGNCEVTMGGMRAVKQGLEKFINEQMQPNDQVAIYQTRKGSSLLQQYTSDKSRLLQIVRKIRWYPPSGICSITGEEYKQVRNESTLKKEGVQSFESEKDAENREARERFTRDNQVTGTIGVLRYAINGLQRIGGRKVIFLMSDSLPISNGRNSFYNSYYAVRDLTELANRASVVINPIDVRGLTISAAQAVDDFAIKDNPNIVEETMAARQLNDNSRQSGLFYTANETGGKFYRNMNNLDYPIQKALDLEKGYYLIAYQPEEDTFKGKNFHKIEVKLKRPDLTVNSRSGFNSLTDKEMLPKKRTGDSELYEAIIAPLPNAELDLRVTASFANTASDGSFVKALLHLDGQKLTFTNEPNEIKKAVFDVVAVTLNEKNEVVDEFNRTHTIRFPSTNLNDIRQNGLIYAVNVPVKKSGVYNFRIVVRDANSKLLGSAGQQIEVPNLKKDDVFLSGLTLNEVEVKDGKPVLITIEKNENAFAPVLKVSNPAIRRFYPGTILGYSYKIYNAQLDRVNNKPRLTVQIRLYGNGQLISDTMPQPAQLEPQSDMMRINDYGYLRLHPDVDTGDYALQIIVKDLISNEITSQWVDFEVIK